MHNIEARGVRPPDSATRTGVAAIPVSAAKAGKEIKKKFRVVNITVFDSREELESCLVLRKLHGLSQLIVIQINISLGRGDRAVSCQSSENAHRNRLTCEIRDEGAPAAVRTRAKTQ